MAENITLQNPITKETQYPTTTANNVYFSDGRTLETGDRVIEQYYAEDGSSWYRIWASGWKECGGIVQATSKVGANTDYGMDVSFPFEFSNTNYHIQATTKWYASQGGLPFTYIYSPNNTTTSFHLVWQNNTDTAVPAGATGAYWEAKGF